MSFFSTITIIILLASAFPCLAASAHPPPVNEPDQGLSLTDQGLSLTDEGLSLTGEGLSLTGEGLSLSWLIQYAISNNAAIKASESIILASAEQILQSTTLPNPELWYNHMAEEFFSDSGYREETVGISQSIPWFGKLSLSEEIAAANLSAQKYNHHDILLKLKRDLTEAYFEYAFLRHSVAVTRQHLSLLRNIEAVALIQFKTGKIPQSVLLQTQIEQAKLEDELEALENLRQPLSTRILALLSVESHQILPWPSDSLLDLPTVDLAPIRESIGKDSPVLRRIDVLAKREELSFSKARKGLYPDLTLGFEYTDPNQGRSTKTIMVSTSLPLWRKSTKAAMREAQMRRQALLKEREDTEFQLKTELDSLIYYCNDAIRKTKLYRDQLIPKAQQTVEISLKGFEAGTVDYSNLLDTERTLLELQLTSVRQAANAHIKVAAIEALIINHERNQQ